MQIEHVAGIRLASGGAFKQQTERTVRHGVLGKIVIHDEHVPAGVHEILRYGAAGIRSDVLHGSGFPRARVDDNGIREGVVLFQRFGKLHHRGRFLPYRNVNAYYVLAFLVEDGVQRDRRLAGLPVADDQLTLSSADGEERVHDEQSRFHGSIDGLTLDYAGRGTLNGTVTVSADLPQPVHGIAQRVHRPAQIPVAYGDAGGLARAPYHAARHYVAAVAEHYYAAEIRAQILYHSPHSALEQDYFAVCRVRKSVRAHYAVADRDHPAGFLRKRFRSPLLYRLPYERYNVVVSGGDLPQPAFQLLEPAAHAPVVHVAAGFEPESAGEKIAFSPFEFGAFAVFFCKKTLETRKLLFGGTGRGIQNSLNLFHLPLPFPPLGGTSRKRRPRPAT